MLVCRVKGNVISTNKTQKLSPYKLLIVVPVDLETLEEKGEPLIAIDNVCAGEGELVICVGGSSSRADDNLTKSPADLAIHAIIDTIDCRGKRTFEKFSETDTVKKG